MRSVLVLIFFSTFFLDTVCAQQVVFDPRHFQIVGENGAVRLVAEKVHEQRWSAINQQLTDIRDNLTAIIAVRRLILRSLTEADAVLKSGRAARNISHILKDIFRYSHDVGEMIGRDPWLLAFSEDLARRLKQRSVKLAVETSDFVLKEGGNVLMNFEKRDFLLKKITLELQVIRALCYSLYRALYWASVNGAISAANPFGDFISQDRRLAREIIYNYKQLKD